MGWRRLALVPLGESPGAAAEGPALPGPGDATAAPAPEVALSAAERVALQGWLARLAEEGETLGSGAGTALEDAAQPITAATLACLVDQLERQRCVAFTGAELSRLLVLLARLRARCAAARAGALASRTDPPVGTSGIAFTPSVPGLPRAMTDTPAA